MRAGIYHLGISVTQQPQQIIHQQENGYQKLWQHQSQKNTSDKLDSVLVPHITIDIHHKIDKQRIKQKGIHPVARTHPAMVRHRAECLIDIQLQEYKKSRNNQ